MALAIRKQLLEILLISAFNDAPRGTMNRRDFLTLTALTALASKLQLPLAAEGKGNMQYRSLGSTGEKVSIVGLGGYHIGMQQDEKESIAIIRKALDGGINFLDNCWDYNDGESEVRMGKALREGYRAKAFLMTKIDGRDGKTAAQQIDQSLKRLQTDHIDLMQFHEIIRLGDPERIFAANGALESVQAAKKAGKIRYIGFTGHKNPEVHLKMFATAKAHNFHFDTVQMPLNVMDAHFESFGKKVVPVAMENKTGILGMKSMGDPFILKSKAVTPMQCLYFAMNLPTSVVITGCDSLQILDQAIEAAKIFRPLEPKQLAALLAKTEPLARKGEFELYKTSHHFDGTYKHPEWLGSGVSKETYPAA